jgi:Fe-S cluster assembly iron-binding protein IscA
MSDNTNNGVVTISQKALEFLLKSLEAQSKDSVKMSLIVGRDQNGSPRLKYELQTIEGPDVTIDLGNGKKFVIDGNIVPAVKGTKIDLKEGLDAEGNKVVGFIFDNPNVPRPTSDCSGCPSSKGKGCSTGGCES